MPVLHRSAADDEPVEEIRAQAVDGARPMHLTAPAELVVWGNGCLRAERTVLCLTPTENGVRVEVLVGHVTQSSDVSSELVADFIAGLARELDKESGPDTLRSFKITGIGSVHAKLPLTSGLVDESVGDRDAERLERVANYVLAFIAASGVHVDDRMHPIPSHHRT